MQKQANSLRSLAVLIPVWQPTQTLIGLTGELIAAGFGLVLVVDDGSCSGRRWILEQLGEQGVLVVRHGANRGKGRALKTGFGDIISAHHEIAGVVTADADGQHTVADIVRVGCALAAAAEEEKAVTVLGTRSLDEHVPWRSRLGNAVTRLLFRQIVGTALRDTQSGLRGFARDRLPRLLQVPGERYEYEMAVLVDLYRAEIPPRNVRIATVYTERNRSSHFRPVIDSLRVLWVLGRSSSAGRKNSHVSAFRASPRMR